MKFNSKVTFAGIAGLALVSGVGLYFYKRKYANSNDPKYLLQQLRNSLFGSKPAPFNQIMHNFTQSYNIQLGKYLIQNMELNADNSEIKSRVCKKNLDNQYFYECLDCSMTIKDSKKSLQEQENQNSYSHQMCEDCFDQEIHKGHKYKLIQSQVEGRCDCGHTYLIKESSFCSKHNGFKNLKQEYEQSLPNEVKSKIKEYFKELFYILIDGQSDLIQSILNKAKSTESTKAEQDKNFVQYNILFTLIMDQITELLNINHKFIYIFVELFQEPFEKPIRYQINMEDYTILNQKTINSETTIFEYLLIHQTSLNEKSLQKLDEFIQISSNADTEFLEFTCFKYTKLFKFAISVSHQQDEIGQDLKVFSIPQLSNTCRVAFGSTLFTNKMSIQHQDYFLNIIKIAKNVIPQMSFRVMSDYMVTQDIFQYLFDIFSEVSIVENYTILDELVEMILDLFEIAFDNIEIVTTRQYNIMQNLQLKFMTIGGNLVLQTLVQDILFTVTSFAHKGLSSEKKELVLRVLCKKYKEFIEKAHEKGLKHLKQFKEDRTYLGLSIANLIVNITIISEGAELSSQNVMKAIKKNFNFSNEGEVDEFIKKIIHLMHCNLVNYCYDGGIPNNQNGFLLLAFTTSMLSIPQYVQVIQYLWFTLLSAEQSVYDSNTLALQLVSSLQNHKDQLVYKYVQAVSPQNCNSPTNQNIFVIKPTNCIKNIMFDQTPLININKKLQNILSEESKEIQQCINYAAKQVINNLLKWFPNKTKSYSQFVEQVQQCILDKDLINRTLSEFGTFKSEDDSLNIKSLDSLEKVSLNIGRYFNNLNDENQLLDKQPYSIFNVDIGVFEKLYKFQQDLIIKTYMYPELLEECKQMITKIPIEVNFIVCILCFDQMLFIWADLIQLHQKQPNIFSNEQHILIQQFEKILITKENKEFFKPKFKLILEHIARSNKKEPIPKALLLNDLLDQVDSQ